MGFVNKGAQRFSCPPAVACCIEKWLKLTIVSGKVNQSESRILELTTS